MFGGDAKVQAMDKTPGWEREFYNSYGNYNGYRFQDFSCGCPMQTDDGWANCNHPKHGGAGTNHRPCECRQCPCVEDDIDEGDTIDYSEGEQPIRVIETPVRERQNGCQNCTHSDCEVRDNSDMSWCPTHSLKPPNAEVRGCANTELSNEASKI